VTSFIHLSEELRANAKAWEGLDEYSGKVVRWAMTAAERVAVFDDRFNRRQRQGLVTGLRSAAGLPPAGDPGGFGEFAKIPAALQLTFFETNLEAFTGIGDAPEVREAVAQRSAGMAIELAFEALDGSAQTAALARLAEDQQRLALVRLAVRGELPLLADLPADLRSAILALSPPPEPEAIVEASLEIASLGGLLPLRDNHCGNSGMVTKATRGAVALQFDHLPWEARAHALDREAFAAEVFSHELVVALKKRSDAVRALMVERAGLGWSGLASIRERVVARLAKMRTPELSIVYMCRPGSLGALIERLFRVRQVADAAVGPVAIYERVDAALVELVRQFGVEFGKGEVAELAGFYRDDVDEKSAEVSSTDDTRRRSKAADPGAGEGHLLDERPRMEGTPLAESEPPRLEGEHQPLEEEPREEVNSPARVKAQAEGPLLEELQARVEMSLPADGDIGPVPEVGSAGDAAAEQGTASGAKPSAEAPLPAVVVGSMRKLPGMRLNKVGRVPIALGEEQRKLSEWCAFVRGAVGDFLAWHFECRNPACEAKA
jgi:hypothetical protein